MPGFVGDLPYQSAPSVSIGIQKLGNGFVTTLQTNPPVVHTHRAPVGGDLDPDEALDHLIDGIGAFLREINDKGAGEGWKDGEDRQKVRAAARLLFPQFSSPTVPEEPQEHPRYEQLVFESKAAMIEYLNKNL